MTIRIKVPEGRGAWLNRVRATLASEVKSSVAPTETAEFEVNSIFQYYNIKQYQL